jgi:hypothetical protein
MVAGRKLNGVVLSNLAYLSQCACKQLTGSDADVIAVGLGRQPAFNSAPRVLYFAVHRQRNLKAWLAFRYSAIVSAN